MAKQEYRINNWAQYNESLKNRGSINLFINEETLEHWNEPKIVGKNGRPKEYSTEAIVCILQIRLMYNLSLRQAQGFVESIFKLAGIKQKVPNYSLICLRQKEIELPQLQAQENNNNEAIDIVIDSTGMKVYGEGEWKVRTHGASKRRTWKKIHIAIDPKTHQIIAEEMTEKEKGDSEELPELLDQVAVPINRVIADGAYDTTECYEAIKKKGATAIIPPRANACLWPQEGTEHPRNKAVTEREKHGSKQWKKDIGYHKRSLVETTMYRLKTIFTGRFKARLFKNQQLEARLHCLILNKLTALGMPNSFALGLN